LFDTPQQESTSLLRHTGDSRKPVPSFTLFEEVEEQHQQQVGKMIALRKPILLILFSINLTASWQKWRFS
jgi:hypothetical protein